MSFQINFKFVMNNNVTKVPAIAQSNWMYIDLFNIFNNILKLQTMLNKTHKSPPLPVLELLLIEKVTIVEVTLLLLWCYIPSLAGSVQQQHCCTLMSKELLAIYIYILIYGFSIILICSAFAKDIIIAECLLPS